MHQQIWKYQLSVGIINSINMPDGAEVLTVAMQRDEVCMWVRLSQDDRCHVRHFSVVGTGWNIDYPNAKYCGTAFTDGAEFVWHVLEIDQGDLR